MSLIVRWRFASGTGHAPVNVNPARPSSTTIAGTSFDSQGRFARGSVSKQGINSSIFPLARTADLVGILTVGRSSSYRGSSCQSIMISYQLRSQSADPIQKTAHRQQLRCKT